MNTTSGENFMKIRQYLGELGPQHSWSVGPSENWVIWGGDKPERWGGGGGVDVEMGIAIFFITLQLNNIYCVGGK